MTNARCLKAKIGDCLLIFYKIVMFLAACAIIGWLLGYGLNFILNKMSLNL